MSSIVFSHVFFSYPAAEVLRDVSFTCSAGERLCLVGPNGSGKTTTLRLATGELAPTNGYVRSASTCRPAMTPGLGSVADAMDAACADQLAVRHRFDEIATLLGSERSAAIAEEYDVLLSRMIALDIWSLEARVERTLAGLGLDDVDHRRPLAELSPGQQGRIHLAELLLVQPEMLVLDEPTNHLDASARDFLVTTVVGWSGAVLFASHDRDFIDATATGILDLDVEPWRALATVTDGDGANGVFRCSGNYTDYLSAKSDARDSHRTLHSQQQATKRELHRHRQASATIGHPDRPPRTEARAARKFYADRVQRTSTRRISDDVRRLEALSQVEARKPRYEATAIELPAPSRTTAGIAVSVRRAAVPGRLSQVSFELGAGEHLLITGSNSSGKTTLLDWLGTRRPPTAGATGELDTASSTVLIPQRLPCRGDDLVPEETWLRGVGDFGKGFVHPRFWSVPVGDLSHGNQRRVQLGLAAARAPEVLLIDEPTNYLDLDTLESLEEALFTWRGTLVVSTHDDWLIRKWTHSADNSFPVRLHLALQGGGGFAGVR